MRHSIVVVGASWVWAEKTVDEAVTIGLLEDPCNASASMHTNERKQQHTWSEVALGAQRCPFQYPL